MIGFAGVGFAYPGRPPILQGFSLEVPRGQFCVLAGASGSGKSTVLRLVNALLAPTAGRVTVDGRDNAGTPPIALRRRIGYVPQGGGLFPHLNILENAALPLDLSGDPSARASAREALEAVKLPASRFGDRFPDELSGGQRQRAAVARALSVPGAVILMDEPFGALDNALREELQEEVGALLRRMGKTVLFVTHDMHEAVHLGDRIVVMEGGRVLADGTPAEVVLKAADPFVERLLGRRRSDLERFVREKARG